ncbi:hypothetical protein K788_00030450 (plasmid) [Paraburkholderia caribensis MBA4]|uniref:Uncharacterized protein n=1 Tax=Paraburkholderia caribensis MBA4 TaxID=1323664 RepID=A0A0P0RR72_9BURK|nr:hypothetical protein K788_00030450 [Paraburkholderia caribensis MBA4]
MLLVAGKGCTSVRMALRAEAAGLDMPAEAR